MNHSKNKINSDNKSINLRLAMLLFILYLNGQYAAAITSLSQLLPTVSNTYVSQSSTISFVVTLSSSVKFAAGNLYFNVPSPGSFTPATSACSCTLGSVTITSCTVSTNTVTMTFTISITTSGSLTFKVTNFNNPPSTTAITGIIGTYSDTSNVPIQTYTTAQLSGLSPNIMSSTPIYTSDNPTIGATGATLTVRFTPDYAIPSNGQISLIFPVWSSSQQMIQTTNPACIGTSPLNAGLTCSFNTISLTLTITNIASSTLSASTQYTFTVNNLRNPYSGVPKSGFILQTLDNYGGQMQSTTLGSLQVTSFAQFASASIDLRGDSMTTVSELSILQPYFELDLPLDPNCRLRITFPSDMPLTTDLIQVTGTSPYIFASTNSFYSNIASNQYVEINGCPSSLPTSTNFGFLSLTSLKNKAYVQNSNSFTFTLYAINGGSVYNIAEQTTGITINDFTPGIITAFTVTSATANYNVQESTIFRCTITPSHDIPTSSQITIQFPSSIILNSGACTIGSTTGVMSSSPLSCNIALNTITIVNPFGGSSYSSSNGAFQFTFQTGVGSSGTNPTSTTATTGTFIVNTYAINAGTYQIDSSTFSDIYVGVATVLGGVSITVSPNTACTSPASYTFSITPNKQIPSNGKIRIAFPLEVELPSGTLSSCQTIISGTTNNSPTCTVSSTSPVTVIISGSAVFSTTYTTTGTPFTVTLNGLTNPTSTSASSTFQVFTMDSSSNQIEYATSGITVTMSSISPINSVTSSLSSTTNGAVGNILMTVINSCPLATNSVFYFTIPSEVTVPTGVGCSVVSGLVGITCSNTGNAITAFLSVASTLAVGSTFKFTINSITNPLSTCVTSAFSAISLAPPASSANAYTGTNPTLQTILVPTATGSLQQASIAFNTQNDYTIVYTNNIQIPNGSTFKIGYPSGITVNTLTSCYLTISTVTYPMSCTYTSTSPRYIYMTSTGLSVNVPTPSSIMLTFGPITNPSSGTALPSLTLVSYTDQAQSCAVEQVTSNMIVQFPCTSPCATCVTSSTHCTSCIGGYFLYQNTCINPCPSTTVAVSTVNPAICSPCGYNCATCNSASPSTCLTCTLGYLLYAGQCLASCPQSTYLVIVTNTCTPCNFPCFDCAGSPSNCISCNTQSALPFFYQGTCIACPVGTSYIAGICTSCTSPCATCAISKTHCTSCKGGNFLYSNTCLNLCPSTTVAITTVTPQICLPCGADCQKCSELAPSSVCLTCNSGFVLYNGACIISTCPSGTYQAKKTKNCFDCNSNCQTCQGSNTNCLTCNQGSAFPLLFEGTCVASCPSNSIQDFDLCLRCTSHCLTCTALGNNCQSCESGYTFDQNTCTKDSIISKVVGFFTHIFN